MSGDSEEIIITLPGSRANKIIPQRKLDYAAKLKVLLNEFNKCLLVGLNNVGSRQIANMRKDFRGRARILCGKNTLIRKVLRDHMKETRKNELMSLMEVVRGNIGFIFTKDSIPELRKEVLGRKRQSAAKEGTFAPVDVFIPAGPTGMEPTQTIVFQAMDIPTRINRGQIDITDRVHLIHKGDKVNASQAALLVQLNIKPFYYGMTVQKIYENGEVYDSSVLDITSQMVAASFYRGLANVSALCFEMDEPCTATAPHSFLHAYKDVLALGLSFADDGYSWEGLDNIRKVLADPNAFAGPAATAGADAGAGAGAAAAAAAPPKEDTPEPESSVAAGNMFGAGGDSSDDSDSDSESD